MEKGTERSIDDSDLEFGSLELPEGDIDGDTTLTLSLELVEHPGCDDASLRLHAGKWASRCTHHT